MEDGQSAAGLLAFCKASDEVPIGHCVRTTTRLGLAHDAQHSLGLSVVVGARIVFKELVVYLDARIDTQIGQRPQNVERLLLELFSARTHQCLDENTVSDYRTLEADAFGQFVHFEGVVRAIELGIHIHETVGSRDRVGQVARGNVAPEEFFSLRYALGLGAHEQ